MRPWKHILVVVGALAVVGAFLPLIEVHTGKGKLEVSFAFSARELTFGMQRAHKLIERKLPGIVEKHLPQSVREDRDDIRTVVDAARFAMLLFVPPALLLVLGILGLYRGRVGRGIGAAAIVLGLISIASWFVLRYGVDYGLEDAELERTTVVLQIGAHLLIACGLGGAIAGIGALVRPDVPRAWRPHVPPPPV